MSEQKVTPNPPTSALYELGAARFEASSELAERYFDAEAEQVAQACLAMARRFIGGGRLLAFGAAQTITDAQHIAVEFVHPVIVGKRALPAIALGSDIAATVGTAMAVGWEQVYARQLAALGQPADIAVGIDPSGQDDAVRAGLAAARQAGMLTLGLSGGSGDRLAAEALDFCFVVPAEDPGVIQETHETLYHILWELVHVFFDHQGLLE